MGCKKGGDTLGVNNEKQENRPVAFESAATEAELLEKLEQYLQSCHSSPDEDRKKANSPFPNLAGFCRQLGWGATEMELLQKEFIEFVNK